MPRSLVVLYDAECRICQEGKTRLEKLDRTRRLEFLPLQAAGTRGRFQTLDAGELRRALHLLTEDGRVFTGALAFREIGRAVSPWSIQGALLKGYAAATRIPGAMFLAERIYRLIANHRHRWDPLKKRCDDSTCATTCAKADGS